MLSLVQPHHYYQNILAQGLGMGLGMGVMFLPTLSIPAHYFKAHRTTATGVMLCGKYRTIPNNVYKSHSCHL